MCSGQEMKLYQSPSERIISEVSGERQNVPFYLGELRGFVKHFGVPLRCYKALHALHLPFTIKFLLHVYAVFVHPFSVSAFPALMVTWVLEPITVVLERRRG